MTDTITPKDRIVTKMPLSRYRYDCPKDESEFTKSLLPQIFNLYSWKYK